MGNPAWKYEQRTGEFLCTWDGCTYSHDSPNAVQLHYAAKHQRKGKAAPAAQPAQQPQLGPAPAPAAQPAATRRQGHQHEWVLLDRSRPRQARAYRDGYKEVCSGCLELR